MNREEWEILREGWAFEAKLAQGRDGRGELPASFWETYSAFANTDGGVIVLGAAERNDGSLEVRGIADLDKVERELWNNLQNPQKVSANLLTSSSVTREELDGHQLLVVRVPKTTRTARPVHLNGSLERSYQRVHEGDRRMRPEVARRRSPTRSSIETRPSSSTSQKLTSIVKACVATAASSRRSAPSTRSSPRTTPAFSGRSGRSRRYAVGPIWA
ncbi:helix-turn-helix domain-containing protein [Vulgatibacter incomptus]|uniref:Schlafen AlbA-2 domain-containing protein n=1 Tax=Vulgatibacter incomptus TaxID=1391653 RepID=A0A0K1PGV6_9BACT|nr:ATP-binding protein [Vulgatibacter incomptus]AKU92732.1 hypothetical protein AKJ08_3119 [Vulgatibacter incomptus]